MGEEEEVMDGEDLDEELDADGLPKKRGASEDDGFDEDENPDLDDGLGDDDTEEGGDDDY